MKTKDNHNLTMDGEIVSVSERTAKVRVTKHRFHPIYKKRYTIHQTYLADVAIGKKVIEGDLVTIERTKPLSKRKVWRVK